MTFQGYDSSTFKARFAENLIRCRKRAGLSQERVALRASLSRGAVNKYEKEVNVPCLDTVIRLGGPGRDRRAGTLFKRLEQRGSRS
jgi:transcriptional regulator with XRE-family HTH domain